MSIELVVGLIALILVLCLASGIAVYLLHSKIAAVEANIITALDNKLIKVESVLVPKPQVAKSAAELITKHSN